MMISINNWSSKEKGPDGIVSWFCILLLGSRFGFMSCTKKKSHISRWNHNIKLDHSIPLQALTAE